MTGVTHLPPPVAPRRPHTRSLHGEGVHDDYAWMRQVDDPELLAYLEAENAYTGDQTRGLRDLQQQIFDELRSVLPEDDVMAPWREGEWIYYARRRAGQQYLIHCRRPATGGDEQVVLDENALAKGHAFLSMGNVAVSPDGRLVAYSVDLEGNEVFTLHVRDLTTGETLPDRLEGTYYTLAWAADSSGFLYPTLDPA